jgi:hypothetical protein
MLLGVFPRMCSRCGTRQFEHEGLREAVCGWGMQYLLLLSEGPGVGVWGQLIKHAWGSYGYGIYKYIAILNVFRIFDGCCPIAPYFEVHILAM